MEAVCFLGGGRGDPEERSVVEVHPEDNMIAETVIIGEVTAVFDRQVAIDLYAVNGGATGFAGWWGVVAMARYYGIV